MPSRLSPLVLVLLFAAGVGAASAQAPSRSLFNGTDLSGWRMDVPELDADSSVRAPFVVRDSLLVSLGTPRGHLLTNQTYADYRLTLEYRFAGEPGNAGVLVHASTPRVLYDMFPQSIEVQMEHTNAGDFWCIHENIATPNMVERRGPEEQWGTTEGTNRRIVNLTDGAEKPVGRWNRLTIEAVDDSIKVWVNGTLVNLGYDATAQEGRIALQAEGSEVEFRTLRLTPIDQLSAE